MSTRTMMRRVGWVVVASAGWGASCGGEVAGTSPDANLAGGSGTVESSGGSAGKALSTGGRTSTGGSGSGGSCACAIPCPSSTRAICDPSGECICSMTCDSDPTICGIISRCLSVCDPSGACVCAGACLEAGQIGMFVGCCAGLNELSYSPDLTSCVVDSAFVVCSVCGNASCDTGENRCNCPQDCG